ncbi:hypothetical protein OIU79_005916, partial [Salix purpurea]
MMIKVGGAIFRVFCFIAVMDISIIIFLLSAVSIGVDDFLISACIFHTFRYNWSEQNFSSNISF